MQFDATETLGALAKLPPETPKPVEAGTTAGGIWRAARNAVPAAVAESAAAVVKLGTMAPEGSSAAGGRTEQIGQEVERSLRNVAESYAPDPMTASKAEQVVFGLTRGVGKAVGYGLTTGPLAPLGFGIDEGLTEREKLLRQGVDEATAGKVGALAGVVNAAGFAIPAAGSTVAKTIGLATLSGPASFVAQQAGSREILRAADYESIASSYDPADALGLALSAIPFGFGAWAMRGRFKTGKPAPEAKPAVVNESLTTQPAPDAIPVEPVRAADELGVSPDIAPATPDIAARSPDVVPEPIVRQEHVDAAMVKNLVDFEDGVKANPPEKFEAELAKPAVIENPNFKAWFGDSKVVGDDGSPLIVYHGTETPGFDKFEVGGTAQSKRTGSTLGVGVYLSTSPEDGSVYAGKSSGAVLPVYVRGRLLDLGNLTDDDKFRLSEWANANLTDSEKSRFDPPRRKVDFASREEAIDFLGNQRENWKYFDGITDRNKPKALTEGGMFSVEYSDFSAPVKIATAADAENILAAVDANSAASLGFDGAIFPRGDGSKWIVMYQPDGNIKSAIGNSGRFDPNSPSLTDPIPPKETPADVPTPAKLGTETREAPAPEGKAKVLQIQEGTGPDSAVIQSVRTRADQVVLEAPDLVVGVDENGATITAKEALEKIRREAQEGTENELGAADAPLLDVAVQCALSVGQ